jgi:phage tail sheath gpL-like
MANNVTGATDITGALSVIPKVTKSAIVIAEKGLAQSESITTTPETIFTISGTADAVTKFGSLSKASNLVKILISNGVTLIKGMLVSDYGDGKTYTAKADAYAGAFAKTMFDNSIKVIVLDTIDPAVTAKMKTHLDAAEAEDLFRYHVVGGGVNLSNANYATLAGTINHSRIFLPGPNCVDASNVEMDGIYTAAGISALIMTMTTDPALPMNGVEMLGYGGVGRILLSADKTALVTAGIVPLYTAPSGNPAVYRLVTTYTKNSSGDPDTIWQEGTTRFIADDILESVETRLRSNYKRTKNVSRILDSIKTDVIDVLTIKNGLEIIHDFDKSTVSVIKDPQDIYGALVDYEFKVVTPLYTITIKQHMKI